MRPFLIAALVAAALVLSACGGDDSHQDTSQEPGETGEISHTFAESERVEIGCHQPGHYALGMKIAVSVV